MQAKSKDCLILKSRPVSCTCFFIEFSSSGNFLKQGKSFFSFPLLLLLYIPFFLSLRKTANSLRSSVTFSSILTFRRDEGSRPIPFCST